MIRELLLTSLLAMTAFAGCLADESGEPVEETSASTSSAAPTTSAAADASSPTPSATSAAPAPNSPPTANLSVDVENGSVPLNVTFSLEGSDADGDELAWTLDVDGDGTPDYNGTGLPASAEHSYAEAGNYTAKLNVTDGEASAEAMVTVLVEAAEAPQLREDAWVRWDAEGVCHAKDARPSAGPLYIHDRPGPGQQWGTGLVSTGGGGTWVYEESNGIAGLQVGGTGEDSDYVACLKPDTLIF